jgi:thioredoxin reductase
MSVAEYHEFIIVGAGPAGLQSAIFLQELGLDFLIIEKSQDVGYHWSNFPRHRKLISINKKFTGSSNPDFRLRHDWNSLLTNTHNPLLFTEYSDDLYPSADDLLRYMQDVYSSYKPPTVFGEKVTKISRDKDYNFLLTTQSRTFSCKYLFMATGGFPWTPDIPGLDQPGIDYYENVSLDKKPFQDKRVLIVGKGNSAFECGEHLADTAAVIHFISPRQITFAWNTHFVGDLRAVRNNLLDMYQLKSQHAILNGNIAGIDYNPSNQHAYTVNFEFTNTPDDPCNEIKYDRIIVCTGFKYLDMSLFDHNTINVRIDPRRECRGKFPLITPYWEFADVPHMYAVGAAMQTVNFRKNAGGFIHGFRYTIRTMINILLEKEKNIQLPQIVLDNSPNTLADNLLNRINTASSLYQMYRELCDVIVLSDTDDTKVQYFYDLPLLTLQDRFKGRSVIALIFDFGTRGDIDAFRYVSNASPISPENSAFLHPILLSFDTNGVLSDSLHLLENLETVWSDNELHIKPLLTFLASNNFGISKGPLLAELEQVSSV